MRRVSDLVGKKFGYLTVDSFANLNRESYWNCLCDCGNKTVVRGSKLTTGQTVSCGCFRRNKRQVSEVHVKQLLKRVWYDMKRRCLDTSRKEYKWYGARGIKVCSRWMAFDNFYSDMIGAFQIGLTLDRIDNDGNYEPSNCRWATMKEQRLNQRNRGPVV